MFEKEAEEYAEMNKPFLNKSDCISVFKDGAEFGYSKGKNEAKEIIKLLLHALKNEGSDYTFALENTHPVLVEAKQFIKDN